MDGSYSSELNVAIEAAHIAGEILERYFHAPGDKVKSRHKSGHGPVTDADILADQEIHDLIQSEFPSDSWLSEEYGDKRADTPRADRVWIVDPIDGTREFVHKVPEFSISIGFLARGELRAGVVFNPITNELFSALKGEGSYLNGKKVRVSDVSKLEESRVLISHTEKRKGWYSDFSSYLRVERPIGSIAYKLALISAGKAEGTISLTYKSEWDVAAGTLLIQEAEGVITNIDGNPLLFDKQMPTIKGLIAGNPAVHQRLSELLSQGVLKFHGN